MAKRIYIRPADDKPKPLVSNWPNQDMPNEIDYTVDVVAQQCDHIAKNAHWHILYMGQDRELFRHRDKEAVVLYKHRLRKDRNHNKMWIHSETPSLTEQDNARQVAKAEARWQSGFGA